MNVSIQELVDDDDKKLEVPLLFYKGTKTIKQLQKEE